MTQEVVFRITFRPEYASDFLLDEQIANGQYVVERDDYTMDEAYDFIREFRPSLEDALILVDGEKVVTMSDFFEEIE